MKIQILLITLLITTNHTTNRRNNFLYQFSKPRVLVERARTVKQVEQFITNLTIPNKGNPNWKKLRKINQRKRFFDQIYSFLETRPEVTDSQDPTYVETNVEKLTPKQKFKLRTACDKLKEEYEVLPFEFRNYCW
jgi:hypothetical protein